MIDWDSLVLGPVMGIFGQPVTYTSQAGQVVQLADAVFDDGFIAVDVGGMPEVLSNNPVLGVRIAEMPTGWNPEAAQGDTFLVQSTGVTYTVKAAKADSHGHVRIEGNSVS